MLSTAFLLSSVLAIGEAGLDRLGPADILLQKEVFVRQILLSESVGKPLVIHCVKAFFRHLVLRKARCADIVHNFHAVHHQFPVNLVALCGYCLLYTSKGEVTKRNSSRYTGNEYSAPYSEFSDVRRGLCSAPNRLPYVSQQRNIIPIWRKQNTCQYKR